MVPTGGPETSVTNYQSTLRNMPEEQRPYAATEDKRSRDPLIGESVWVFWRRKESLCPCPEVKTDSPVFGA